MVGNMKITDTRSDKRKPCDTQRGGGTSVFVAGLRRRLFLLAGVQVPLDVCPSSWHILEVYLLKIQRDTYRSSWGEMQG